MQNRLMIYLKWKDCSKEQKIFRAQTYSAIAFLYVLGITFFIFKLFILGTIFLLLPSIAIFCIVQIPKWYMKYYYQQAEERFQQNKNSKDKDEIYLTGEQTKNLIETGGVYMGESSPPIVLEELANGTRNE